MADKSSSVPREGTMDKTIADSHAFLGNSNKSKKSKVQKFSTIKQTYKEALAFCGDIGSSDSGRQLRKRKAAPAPVEKKPAKMKRLGTMATTAKEGKGYLKRTKKGAKPAAAAADKKD